MITTGTKNWGNGASTQGLSTSPLRHFLIVGAAAMTAVFVLMLISALGSCSVYTDHEDPPSVDYSTDVPFTDDENM